MLEVEVFGGERDDVPARADIERLCADALASAGVFDGHVAVEFVSPGRIAELNAEHRGKEGPTDVLSFPIDGSEPAADGGVEPPTAAGSDLPPVPGSASDDGSMPAHGPPRELGDIVICPEHTIDVREAIVHGALHLIGMDHETDDGEMLAAQARILGERL